MFDDRHRSRAASDDVDPGFAVTDDDVVDDGWVGGLVADVDALSISIAVEGVIDDRGSSGRVDEDSVAGFGDDIAFEHGGIGGVAGEDDGSGSRVTRVGGFDGEARESGGIDGIEQHDAVLVGSPGDRGGIGTVSDDGDSGLHHDIFAVVARGHFDLVATGCGIQSVLDRGEGEFRCPIGSECIGRGVDVDGREQCAVFEPFDLSETGDATVSHVAEWVGRA